jgi:uncharacterized protein
VSDPAPLPIVHEAAAGRFSTCVEGFDCVLEYHLVDGVMHIVHTGVPAPVGGRGIAAQLVTAALEQARSLGCRVVPACSYVAAFLRRHPDYQALLAQPR